MITIDYRSRIPIYDQIVNGMIRLKAMGVLKDGDKLPSVRTLASQIGINPNTVQKAYAILETQGLICSVSGKGSFISGDESAAEAILAVARNDFSRAVAQAAHSGLTAEELVSIVDDVCKGGNEL